jgi:hypothetical protein
MLNNRRQEDVSTSRNNLCPDRWDAVLKTATVSFRDERKRMKWPRRRTPWEGSTGVGHARGPSLTWIDPGNNREIELKHTSWVSVPDRRIWTQQASSTHWCGI